MIVYKVTRPNLRSASPPHRCGIQYHIGIAVKPTIPASYLFAFRTRVAAIRFAWSLGAKVFMARATGVRRATGIVDDNRAGVRIWWAAGCPPAYENNRGQTRYRYATPIGTVWCKTIKLLKEV